MKKDKIQINIQATNPVFADVDLNKIPNVSKLIIFSIKDFLNWWYIQMPIYYLTKLERISMVVLDQLSIIVLLTNFFVPWKRDKTVVGYFIGILVKLLYLPIAIPLYITTILIYAMLIVAWLLLPPTTLLFILISLFII